jgi:ABC-2 type transport system permease protein
VRARIGDPIGAHPSWITNHAVLMAVAWPLLLIAVFFPLSLHRFRRLSH